MKMRSALVVGTLMAVGLMACDKNNSDDTNSQDQTYVMQASMSNRAEIDLGNLAASKATASDVKDFAQMMVMDHTQAQADLIAVASSTETDPHLNDSLPADKIALRNKLMAMPAGKSFDSAYIKSQVAGHQETINFFQAEINGGMNGMVKNYATSYLPKIQMHLQMATTIAAKY